MNLPEAQQPDSAGSQRLTPITLTGRSVRLEPLIIDHAGPLAEAAAEDRSSYRFTSVPDGIDGPGGARAWVEIALARRASGRELPFAVRRLADDRVVGSTRLLDLEVFSWPPTAPPGAGEGPGPSDQRPPTVAEIGSTWYAASAQRTGVNTETKLLLLSQVFEVWRSVRVTFKTDARNQASRRAIERLGARPEGVRRAHVPATDGTIRDSAYYSIVDLEWPAVADRLRRLGPPPG